MCLGIEVNILFLIIHKNFKNKNCIDFFLAHYLVTRIQLTTDHVSCLGTLNTEQMVQQTWIWNYKRQFSRISREDRHISAP